jgi:hypothetical protein
MEHGPATVRDASPCFSSFSFLSLHTVLLVHRFTLFRHHSVIILRPDSGFGRSYFLAVKTEEREVWIDNFEHSKATVNIMDSDEQDLDGFEDYGQYDNQYDQYD